MTRLAALLLAVLLSAGGVARAEAPNRTIAGTSGAVSRLMTCTCRTWAPVACSRRRWPHSRKNSRSSQPG